MSAASFLGIAGLIAFYGYDGFMYSVGWLVAYLTVLLLVAEPLRNTGRFTMADVLAFRLRRPVVRVVAAASTLTVSLFYMIAQMVGAGSLVSLLVPGIGFNTAIVGVGVLMLVYVVFGGMLATTWVQIVKAVLLMTGTVLLSMLVLARFDFSVFAFFEAVAAVTGSFCPDGAAVGGVCPDGSAPIVRDFTQPGLYYHGQWGALSLMSLGIALIFGTAGLPHILVRFYTVPSAQAARTSVVWAMILIGSFYIMTTFLGFGAATLVGKGNIGLLSGGRMVANQNLAAPLLAREVGGEIFLSFVAAIAFATILAVVAGLTIAASSAFAHDIWFTVVKKGREDEREQVLVARVTAAMIGLLAIVLAIALRSLNVAFLVGLAFAVAASANVPGDPADALLAALQHDRHDRRDADRPAGGGRPDRAQSVGHGRGRAGRRGPTPDSAPAALSARQSRHRVGPARVPRRRRRYAARPGSRRRGCGVQRAERSRQHRPGGGVGRGFAGFWRS